MRRVGLLAFHVMMALGVAALGNSAGAQQKITKDELIGAWTIVSCTNASGGTPASCVRPHGGMIFDAGGRFAQVFAAGGRPNFTDSGRRAQLSAEDYKSAAQGLAAMFGTWSFDEASQRFTVHTETTLFPNGEGLDVTFGVSRSGEQLRMVVVKSYRGQGNISLFRRAS